MLVVEQSRVHGYGGPVLQLLDSRHVRLRMPVVDYRRALQRDADTLHSALDLGLHPPARLFDFCAVVESETLYLALPRPTVFASAGTTADPWLNPPNWPASAVGW